MRAAAPLQQDVNKGFTARSGVQSARFFIVDPEGRASVAATLLPGAGGVQQEKLLLQINKFCECLERALKPVGGHQRLGFYAKRF
ncbi:hypothetical protein [Pseudomonas sp. LF245]